MKDLERLYRKRRRARRRRELPPGAFAASAAVHGIVVLVTLLAGAAVASPPPPPTYRVNLVAMADESAPERLEPQPPEPAEEEHRPPPPEPTPEPVPKTEQPTVKEEKKPPAEPRREPARAPEEGEEEVNIELAGRSCGELLTQAYCDNITRQVLRYWRRPTGGRTLSAELSFVIREDGSVTGIEWKQRSGDHGFDLEARGAIEAAGRERAFGPLPERYPLDRLRVSFFFDPRRL